MADLAWYYIGEGFDWPYLDTLFLAFPVAFKGRMVQYVGRLLRSHDGKEDVELHHYVDVRIPVAGAGAFQPPPSISVSRFRGA